MSSTQRDGDKAPAIPSARRRRHVAAWPACVFAYASASDFGAGAVICDPSLAGVAGSLAVSRGITSATNAPTSSRVSVGAACASHADSSRAKSAARR